MVPTKGLEDITKKTLVSRAAKKVFAKMREYSRVRNTNFGDVFRQYNDDGDGGIDLDEFSRMLKLLHMDKFVSDEQTKMIFDYADPDGSGEIDYNEFVQIFAAEDPLNTKKEKMGRLQKDKVKNRAMAAAFATPKERVLAKKRISELKERLGQKLLQRLRALGGGAVSQDGRALYRIYKEMDVDGDGVVTYPEFKEMLGPKRFNLGLRDDDVRDLTLVCDPSGDGIIECSEFLKAMLQADDNDGKDVFIDYPQKMIDDMLKAIEDMDKRDPAQVRTSVDMLAPLPASAIPDVQIAPQQRPSREVKSKKIRAKLQRAARKALLLRQMSDRSHDWQALSSTHKTVQQTRIAQARQRKSADLRGSFTLSVPKGFSMRYATGRSYEHSPQKKNTWNRTMYGEDNDTHHAIPDILNDKHKIAVIRRTKGLKRLEHEARLWRYRRDTEKRNKMNEVKRLMSKMRQRKEYLRKAKLEGDRQFKHMAGESVKGLLHSDISLHQRAGALKNIGVYFG